MSAPTTTKMSNSAWYALAEQVVLDTGGEWYCECSIPDTEDYNRVVGLEFHKDKSERYQAVMSLAEYEQFLKKEGYRE